LAGVAETIYEVQCLVFVGEVERYGEAAFRAGGHGFSLAVFLRCGFSGLKL